jgi:hypothetical protein
MQNTLAEVELSAAAKGSHHVFGAGHAEALDELRAAQLALAQGWAKTETDDGASHVGTGLDDGEGDVRAGGLKKEGRRGTDKDEKEGKRASKGEEKSKRMNRKGSDANSESGGMTTTMTLEEETQNDIMLAKTRREANDRYFEQVNNAVVDVVKKLDGVAVAMRKVEKESRYIWSDEDSGTESISESTTGG